MSAELPTNRASFFFFGYGTIHAYGTAMSPLLMMAASFNSHYQPSDVKLINKHQPVVITRSIGERLHQKHVNYFVSI